MLELNELRYSVAGLSWYFEHQASTHSVNAILGKSGSGKSTLLNLIAGFLQPQSGDILWHGQSLLKLPPDQRPVTSLFQHHNLFPHLTVEQNVGLGLHPGLKLNPGERQKLLNVLDQVGLPDQSHKRPAELSGGEQQRVALARCLLRQRPILILDEPFSALDADTRRGMIELTLDVIEQYQPCVFMVTHDVRDADAMGADMLEIRENRLFHVN
ncbi:MAG: ATP-binding cassette domain-containing protein [Granulosicoccus sp.]